MPTLSESAIGQHETVLTGIYIARGDETLGPYNSLEAAALVAGGYLQPDDFAARNGDAAWVSLSEFLPLSDLTRTDGVAPVADFGVSTTASHPHRWRRLAAAFAILLAAALILANGKHWFGHRHADEHPVVRKLPPAAPAKATAAPAPAVEPAPVPQAPPPVAVVDGPVTGLLSLALPGGGQVPVAAVRVSLYPLAALEASLAPINADAQAARARLDPQIAAAATERANRAAEAQAALQALRNTDPSDPLIALLRFANTGAKAASRTAENDYRYLLDERNAAAGGEVFFHALPEPVLTTDTDAQGGFTLPLAPGDEPYAVAVCARQKTDDGNARVRYWLVKLSPAQRSGRESVRLDGSNVSSSLAAESLIQTAD